MDPRLLVTRERAESGRRLLSELAGTPVAPVAAMWARRSERDERTRLFVVSPMVDAGGPLAAYGIVGPIRDALDAELNDPFLEIGQFVVTLLGPSSRLGKGLLEWCRRNNNARPEFYDGSALGDVPIDGAYIYPATLFAPAAPTSPSGS